MQQHVPSYVRTITKWLLFLTGFMTCAIFRHRDYAEKSLDFQILLKLAVWGLAFAFSVACYKFWIKKLLQIDNIFLVLMLLLVAVSCTYSPNVVYSAASAFSLFAVLAIFYLAASVLTKKELLWQLIMACSTIVAISLIVYFVNPDFGRMKEWSNDVLIMTTRLSGITGTANACGFIAATALLSLYFYKRYLQRLTFSYWFLVLMNLGALVLTHSRTSMAALVVAIFLTMLVHATPARLSALFMGICLVIIAALTIDYDTLFQLLSRSGEASEITSGTGRAEIWAFVVTLIAQKPLWGWGYASSNAIIPAAAAEIGFVASHGHNAYLQIAFCIGYIGLFLFAALIFLKIFFALKYQSQMVIGFLFLVLVDGLTEPIAFQGPVIATALVLATALALDYSDKHEENDTPYQQ